MSVGDMVNGFFCPSRARCWGNVSVSRSVVALVPADPADQWMEPRACRPARLVSLDAMWKPRPRVDILALGQPSGKHRNQPENLSPRRGVSRTFNARLQRIVHSSIFRAINHSLDVRASTRHACLIYGCFGLGLFLVRRYLKRGSRDLLLQLYLQLL